MEKVKLSTLCGSVALALSIMGAGALGIAQDSSVKADKDKSKNAAVVVTEENAPQDAAVNTESPTSSKQN